MIAGHLRQRNSKYHIYLSWYENKKRNTILISTGLSAKEKANAKIAEDMLVKARLYFQPEMKYNNEMLTVFKESVLGIKVKKKKETVQTSVISDSTGINLTEKITGEMLFSTFMMRWLLMIRKDIEENTYSGYYYNIAKRIMPYFEQKGILLKDLTADDIQEFYNYAVETYGVKKNTLTKYHANIRKALQYAYKTNKIENNSADKIDGLKKENYFSSYYSKDELNELLKVVKDDQLEIPVLLAASYGLRRSEVIGLKWQSVDFVNDTLTVTHTIVQATVDGKFKLIPKDRTKSKASYRILPLNPFIKKILLDARQKQLYYQKIFKDSYNKEYKDYICVNKNGDLIKPNYITDHFKLIIKKNGLKKITFHGLRHSCATYLYENNARDSDVQKWLGHSDIQTTIHTYVHVREQPNKEMSDIMERFIVNDENENVKK